MRLIAIKYLNRLTALAFIFDLSVYCLPCLEMQQWQTETHEKQDVFRDMDDELKTARTISERMFKVHNERDFDLDWHNERADQLSERWHSIHSQIDSRWVPSRRLTRSVCLRKSASCVCKDLSRFNKKITLQASGPGRYQQIPAALPGLVQQSG